MPVQIVHEGDTVQIVPAPLVSISTQLLKNGAGEAFGVTYSITLTGTILDDRGCPFAMKPDGTLFDYVDPGYSPTLKGPYNVFPITPMAPPGLSSPFQTQQKVDKDKSLTAILSKQKSLRALFATDGQKLSITDPAGSEPAVSCYPRVLSVDFQEGIYVERADYTITLEADTLLNGDGTSAKVNNEGSLIVLGGDEEFGKPEEGKTEDELLVAMSGAFITDFSEDWSIETDEAQGESVDFPRSYRISHNINATGKTHYGPDGRKPAWEQAQKFVTNRLANNPAGRDYPSYPNIMGKIGSGTLNLVNEYRGFNHVRSENLSKSAGSYSVSENWLIAKGSAYENFNLSISSSTDSPFVGVSIDGNIKGLSEYSPSGFGGDDLSKAYGHPADGGKEPNTPPSGAYDNALGKYHEISNTGQFGLTSNVYKRANNSVAVQLNSQPTSVSLGTNPYTGEVTYNLQFDNRPTNIISGVLSETITVDDTYPGDVFAVIPVIGRKTGPVLQYIGGRTEYTRNISINLIMDYTSIPYGTGRDPLLLKKPSVVEPTATQIADLIKELSPAKEPGIRKYFVSPPSESWSPKEGSYNFNLSWTYEMDK
jgi:hypothetical protein